MGAGVTVRRYPTSKGREAPPRRRCWSGGCAAMEQLCGDTPRPGAKGKPQKNGRRGEITFRIKPHTHQRPQRAQIYPVCTRTQRPHRDWDRTVFACLLRRWGQQRTAAGPHKRLTQTCLWVSRSLWRRRGLAVACCRVGGTECSSACMGPFEGGHHNFHYLHHSLASDQITGREHNPTIQQKIGLKIYWAWSCPSEQNPVSTLVSPIRKLP